jgi:2-polyprenyl-6-hydroxyphenyl methylase/3-demethylubiquinone-9 3-methyltransferase
MTGSEYLYASATELCSTRYLWPVVRKLIHDETSAGRIFELGCGNGASAGMLAADGYDVTGVDISESGIRIARSAHPVPRFDVGSAYDDLAGRYGQFPLVVSLEVIEHCFYPRTYAKTVFELLEPGGLAIISTPYHGYWKNLVLALSGKMDDHFTALWDGGHIKFWSVRTLAALLHEAGFEEVRFERAGRIAPLAKSMIATARKPITA